MSISIDIIGDLYLTPDDKFSWEGKATSLYCIITGNISDDMPVVAKTLIELASHYQGIFYVSGPLEYSRFDSYVEATNTLEYICDKIGRVEYLHQQVVVLNNVAILGSNGWYNAKPSDNLFKDAEALQGHYDDVAYLRNSITKLQRHLDVKHIILATATVPSDELYFGEVPDITGNYIPLNLILQADTEHKVKYWVYGSQEKIVDTTINNVNYISNGKFNKSPYWAKILDV